MTRKLTRTIFLFLFIMTVFAVTASAQTAYILESTDVYKEADKTAEVFGEIDAGTKVTLVKTVGGWSKIKKSGKTGFVDADAVGAVKEYSGKAVYFAKDARIYERMTKDSSYASVYAGDKALLFATVGDWAMIKYEKDKWFIEKSNLSNDKPEEKSYKAYVSEDGAKVYKTASKSAKVLGKLDINTELTVVAAKNSWLKVEAGGNTGFIKKNCVSTDKTEVFSDSQKTGYAASDSAKVYKTHSSSSEVLAELKVNTELNITGYSDNWYRVKHGSNTGYMMRSDVAMSKVTVGSSVTPARGTAKEMDWWTSGISSIFSVGTVVTVTDVETGIAWREKRLGGTNHADCQPLTKEDTAAMLKACGSWSWTRRAIFVTIDGVNYAASMNCMPHGSDSISDNDFDGHHCIHFTNSRTHGTNRVCSLHQAAIKKAAAATLK